MGGPYGSWAVLRAVALCAAFGVSSGMKMFIPQEISICDEDTLMEVALQKRQGDNGEQLYSGSVYTPQPVDENCVLELGVHLPSGDSYAEDPMVVKVPDPCNTLRTAMPSMMKTLAAIVNREPACPVPKGNYTFEDQPLKIPLDIPMLPPGKYKVHMVSYIKDKKASCADLILKLVNE